LPTERRNSRPLPPPLRRNQFNKIIHSLF
jgi:hypothetical protein